MKLFNAIATAVVLGGSCIAPNPAQARNGWVFVGKQGGADYYMRSLGKKGEIVRIDGKWTDYPKSSTWEYNCSLWQKRLIGGPQGWTTYLSWVSC